MAWDFSTEPEFQAHLDWMAQLVREEIWPLEAMYRYARGARLYDGPDEVHRQLVARQILRNYEPPPGGLPSEHVPTRRAEARERFAELLEAATSND